MVPPPGLEREPLPSDPGALEVIRSEDLVWVANAPEPDVLGQAVLPLARSGHAISVLPRMAVPSDLFVVMGGPPALPTIGIALECSDPHPSLAVQALGDHIRAVLPTL